MKINPFYPGSTTGISPLDSVSTPVTPTAGGSNFGAGLVASGVISGLSDIATTFINAQRVKNTYKFNSAMANLQGDFNARMAGLQGDFNASMAGLQGRMIRLSADVEIKNIRQKAASLFSQQRADYARAGMDIREGSPVAVMMNDLKEAELDEIYANISADYNIGLTKTQADIYGMEANTQSDIYRINANTQAAINNMSAKSAQIDAFTSAGNTILKIGTKIATRN